MAHTNNHIVNSVPPSSKYMWEISKTLCKTKLHKSPFTSIILQTNKQVPSTDSYLPKKMSSNYKPRKTLHSRDQFGDSTTEVLILNMSCSKQNPKTSQTYRLYHYLRHSNPTKVHPTFQTKTNWTTSQETSH